MLVAAMLPALIAILLFAGTVRLQPRWGKRAVTPARLPRGAHATVTPLPQRVTASLDRAA